MSTKTLILTPTELSLSFVPKFIAVEHGKPIVLGRRRNLGVGYPEMEEFYESPNDNVYFASDAGYNPVSKQHAIVWMDHEGKIFIQDLDSSNGTFVNGIRLIPQQPKQLNTGDILRLGISLHIEHADIKMTPVIATVSFMDG